MENKSQQRDETEDPRNPPRAVVEPELNKTPLFVVPGMWYYLGPVGVIVLVLLFTFLFWNDRQDLNEGVVPTTGVEDRVPARGDTPGGNNPDPRHDSTRDEQEFRGGDGR